VILSCINSQLNNELAHLDILRGLTKFTGSLRRKHGSGTSVQSVAFLRL
jgi:hypothetical protein